MGRVPLPAADHVEVGYWLDAAATGQGLATEATRALLAAAAMPPGMTHVEIRCDAANGPSAAVPRRLRFHLAAAEAEVQVWRKRLARRAASRATPWASEVPDGPYVCARGGCVHTGRARVSRAATLAR
jgi:hypothetical protein